MALVVMPKSLLIDPGLSWESTCIFVQRPWWLVKDKQTLFQMPSNYEMKLNAYSGKLYSIPHGACAFVHVHAPH
jgi:hypothetical protein